MGFSYTPSQRKVIDLRDRNILVSAAAGSGKTAVLVERIIEMISDETRPVDIDRLLVVTFTNAAAAEMRERISAAIAKKLQEMPDNVHLQKQSALIHNAQITTIDSFCLFVIRNNFNDIGLDPAIRIVDEGELKLLQKDTLKELLEEHFAAKDEAFYHCLESFSENGSEKPLAEHILSIYQFAMSYPWPTEWILERKQDYNITTKEQLNASPFICYAVESVKKRVDGLSDNLKEALAICNMPDGPYMYASVLEQDMQMIEKLHQAGNFAELAEASAGVVFARLPVKKDASVSEEKKEAVKQIRNDVKAAIKKLREKYFYATEEQLIEQLQFCKPTVDTLLSLTQEFCEKLTAKKREKKVIDFADMEHLALDILVQKEGDSYVPTKAALDYREYFTEIMIDEYQDSNMVQELLLKSISKEDLGGFNRFMVGDVKQSIYKFRLARPEIFLEKFDTYTQEDSKTQRIDLQQNFRSRSEVLESVNFIFRQLMGKALGGVEYDDDAALYPGAVYPESGVDNATELLLLTKEEDGATDTAILQERDLDDKELEALMIAKRIKELMREFQVKDSVSGQMRNARFGDMVILLRTNAGWDDVFKRVLTEQGIPCYAASKTGYFSSPEVQDVLNALRVIDNPLQDIPLFGMLHSVFGKFTEVETACIKAAVRDRKIHFYDALKQYLLDGEGALQEKVSLFLHKLDSYRQMISYTPIQQFIRFLFNDNGYLHYVAALPAGEQRLANVEMLLEKAADFEQTSYFGLFHFIRYIEQMEKYDVDYGEANILNENADTVRIMSIHKSKGLEFPICFVAGLSKTFNRRETAGAILLDVDMGIAIDYIDPVRRIKASGFRKNILADKMRLDSLGEELRVLYVALTRAKEKLILTGSVKNLKGELAKLTALSVNDTQRLSFLRIADAGSYLQFLLSALFRHRCFMPVLQLYEMDINTHNALYDAPAEIKVALVSPQELDAAELKEALAQEDYRIRLQYEAENETPCDDTFYRMIRERFSFQYPHTELAELFTKTTVSELKKAGQKEKLDYSKELYETEELVPYIPSFIEEQQGMSGASRGSAYHKVLELLDMNAVQTAADVTDYMKKLCADGKLSEEYAQAVSLYKIERFLQSALCERMRRARERNALYKEQPFVLGIPANVLRDTFPADEMVLVQGIIDVFFIEDEQIVLADYKTDAVNTPEELIRRYQTQLDYYAKALEQLLEKPVKEKRIYSFALGKEILLN